jgi:hypothetical protein
LRTAAKAIIALGRLDADAAKALTDAIAYDPVFLIEDVQIEDIGRLTTFSRSKVRRRPDVAVQQRQQELAREKIKADIALTQATDRGNSVCAKRRPRPMPSSCAAKPRHPRLGRVAMRSTPIPVSPRWPTAEPWTASCRSR